MGNGIEVSNKNQNNGLKNLPKQDKYICRIHDVKPEHCRNYPKSRKHAQKTGCKGFESRIL